MLLKDLLKLGVSSLGFSATPSLDARILLQHAASLTPESIIMYSDQDVSEEIIKYYEQLIARRINREPIAKIIGKKAFWNNDFLVNENTLDPRPDTEVIILEALRVLPSLDKEYKFLDLGAGSGCLLLSLLLEFPKAKGVAIDISLDALKIVQQNIMELGLKERAFVAQQNWADAFGEQKFDLIVSNPPYIPSADIESLELEVKKYDPMLALDGGEDGLLHYRYLAKQISSFLKRESYAILEFGYGQEEAIKKIFLENNYKINRILFDLSGIARAIVVSLA